MDGFRDRCNSKFGWADPMDPARRRALAIPDHELKLARNAERLGAPVTKASDREKLHEAVCGWIREGQVNDRPELEEKFRRAGYEIVRDGEDYLSIRSHRDPPKGMPRLTKSMRMKGGIWSRAFRSRDYAMALIDDAKRQELAGHHIDRKAPDDDEYQRCLERRRKFNFRRYPAFHLPDDEPTSPKVRIGDVRSTAPIERTATSLRMVKPVEVGGKPIVDAAKVTKLRLFRSLYAVDLPEGLVDQIRFVNVDEKAVFLADGSVVQDTGDSILCNKSSKVAVRLMALEASAKQWTVCKITGPDDFLTALAVACGHLGISVSGIDDRCQQIINDALVAAELPIRRPDGKQKPKEDTLVPELDPHANVPLRKQGGAVPPSAVDLSRDDPEGDNAAEPDEYGPSI